MQSRPKTFRNNFFNEKIIQFIEKYGAQKKIRKNDVIFLEEEDAASFYVIKKGMVKISRLNQEGKEVIIAILQPGNFFGEMGLLDDSPRSTDVSAETDVELLTIRQEDFFRLLNEYPTFSIAMLKELASRLRNSDSQIKGLSILNARGKAASALLRWAIDLGRIDDKSIVITGEYANQKEMASYVGLTRETFNRNLHELKKEGFLTILKDRSIVIQNFVEYKQVFGPFF